MRDKLGSNQPVMEVHHSAKVAAIDTQKDFAVDMEAMLNTPPPVALPHHRSATIMSNSSHSTSHSDIDSFLSDFIIPPPPITRSVTRASTASSRVYTPAAEDKFLPPPLAQSPLISKKKELGYYETGLGSLLNLSDEAVEAPGPPPDSPPPTLSPAAAVKKASMILSQMALSAEKPLAESENSISTLSGNETDDIDSPRVQKRNSVPNVGAHRRLSKPKESKPHSAGAASPASASESGQSLTGGSSDENSKLESSKKKAGAKSTSSSNVIVSSTADVTHMTFRRASIESEWTHPGRENIQIIFADDKTIEVPISASTDVRTAISIALVLNDIESRPENWGLFKQHSILAYPEDTRINSIIFKDDASPKMCMRRIAPDNFQVTFQPAMREPFPLFVNIFTTGDQALRLINEIDTVSENKKLDTGIWKLTLDGKEPRFVETDETPFNSQSKKTRYLLKEQKSSPTLSTLHMQLIKVYINDGFYRGIVVPDTCTAQGVLNEFFGGLNIDLNEQQMAELNVAARKEHDYNIIEKNAAVNVSECWLMVKNFCANLDDIDALSMGKMPSEKVHMNDRQSIAFPSLEDIKSILTSLAYPSDDQLSAVSSPPTRQKIVQTAKIADMLGLNTEMEVSEVKTRLHEIYDSHVSKLTPSAGEFSSSKLSNSTNSSERRLPQEDAPHAGSKISKLTSILGIDNENQLAALLLQSSKKKAAAKQEKMRQRLVSDVDGDVDGTAEPVVDKSVQKLSKILGVNGGGDVQQFRSRKMAQLNTFKPGVVAEESGASSFFNPKAKKEAIAEPVLPEGPKKPTIVDGKFLVKVYLLNQTFKSINVPADITAEGLVLNFIEKLNIKEDSSNYAIFHNKKNEDTLLDNKCKIFELVSKFEDRELLVFKRRSYTGRRSSIESVSSASANRDSASSIKKPVVNNRRAAKVANIFGINERKNVIMEEDNPDIKAVVKMLNSLGTQDKEEQKRMSKNFQIQNIVKEGWLLKEEGDITIGQSKTKNCWCFIENGAFHAKIKSSINDNFAEPVHVKVKNCNVTKHSTRKNCFTISLKSNPKMTFVFYADSTQSCSDWVDAFSATSPSPRTISAVTNMSDAPFQHNGQRVEAKVTMNDFEIKKVLGRGKFGKVLLCSQISTGKIFAIKVIKKSTVRDEKQFSNSASENRILRAIRHPFMVNLHYAFQTPERLHLVMEYVNGGELFFHVNHFGRFSEERVVFYAAEIFLALQCLHGKGIIYRDLKLENILLGNDGHIKITDFGLSKMEDEVDEDESVIAGTSEYLAPEVLGGLPHSYSADWWAYAVVVFEMLCGYHPFYCEDRDELFHRIMYLKIAYPSFVPIAAKSFLSGLFQRDPERRLGSGPTGTMEIQTHDFFRTINFDLLFQKAIEPPFKPEVDNDLDVSYFDDEFTNMPAELTPPRTQSILRASEDQLFTNFTFNGDNFLDQQDKNSRKH
eukprot:Partr_v1_DN28811_c2_g1_i1_m33881 putative Ribosomal protein S6 kinase